jgi:peptidoglycan/LPS O-acetylase OafA/YrhL
MPTQGLSNTGANTAEARSRAIDSLTGIRGVGAVWVFLTHYQAVLAAYLNSDAVAENRFLYNGFRGVDLFFVLSGFILMHVHGTEFQTIRAETTRRFYVLRFLRVYPLNTVVLLALIPVALAMPELVDWFRSDHGVPIPYHDHDFSAAGFVQSLLLAQTWTVLKLGEWNGPAWSLSAEVVAYAAFPPLAFAFMRVRSVALCFVGAGLSLAALMVLLVLGHHTGDSPTGTFGLIRCVFSFIAGSLMARAFLLGAESDPVAARRGGWLSWASVGFIAATLAVQPLNMFAVFGFCGLIYALAFQRGGVNRLMSSAPMMFLGRISFSLYIIHYVPLKISVWLLQTQFPQATLPMRAAIVVAIPAIIVLLAMLTHAAVERPFQRYARDVLRRRPGGAVAALAS